MQMSDFRQKRGRRGNSLLEFALVSVFLVPLLFGTVNLGMNLGRSIQAAQVVRDIGHLYVRQLDFSIPASTNFALRLATGLGMTATGGEGVIILSKIMYIEDAQCIGFGLDPALCPNRNKAVVVQRFVIGNASLRQSSFATPNPAIVLATDDLISGLKKGDILPSNFLTNPSAVANGITTLLPGMTGGDVAYVTEGYFRNLDFTLQQAYSPTTEGVYVRSIF
jgi:hypothetical protein